MVWLSGSAGMLGKHLAEKFTSSGVPFEATDIDVDITDISAVTSFVSGKSFKWVIVCASYTAVDRAEDEPDAAFAVNAKGIKNIAETFSQTDTKIIYFSTDYVFPGTSPQGYREDDAPSPLSVYGKSKLEGEKYLASLSEKFFIFRISWLYGPYGGNFVHTMLNLFKERNELNVVNDHFGSPTYTGDLADFIAKLIKDNGDKYGVYHFSGEDKTDWHEFASEIYRLALKYGLTDNIVNINPVDSTKYPQKAKRPVFSYLLKDKLISTFNYRPGLWRVTLEEYIGQLQK